MAATPGDAAVMQPPEQTPRADAPGMLQALLVVARAIAFGADRRRTRVARRRPMHVEISVLRERLDAALEQNALLRARLGRLAHRRRPQYRRDERPATLYHAARFGLSVEKTAGASVVSVSAIMGWRRESRAAAPGEVSTRPLANKRPERVADLARRLRREWPRSSRSTWTTTTNGPSCDSIARPDQVARWSPREAKGCAGPGVRPDPWMLANSADI